MPHGHQCRHGQKHAASSSSAPSPSSTPLKSKKARFLQSLFSCDCLRGTKKSRICLVVVIVVLICGLIVLGINSLLDVEASAPSFELAVLRKYIESTERVRCVDMSSGTNDDEEDANGHAGGGISLLFVANNLTLDHACQLRDVQLRGDKFWTQFGSREQVLTLPVSPTKYNKLLFYHENRHSTLDAAARRGQKRRYHPESENLPFETVYRTQFVGFPRTPFGNRYVTSFLSTPSYRDRDEIKVAPKKRHQSRDAAQDASDEPATLLLSPHYPVTLHHPVHSLECHFVLARAIDRWLGAACPAAAATPGGTRLCFTKVKEVMFLSKKQTSRADQIPDTSRLEYHAIRAILMGAFRRAGLGAAAGLAVPIRSVPRNARTMVRRLVVPGSLYDLFPSHKIGEQFRFDLKDYFHTLKPTRPAADPHAPPKRKVVFMARSRGRTITDEAEFVSFIEKCAAALPGGKIEVQRLRAGSTRVEDLAADIDGAQLLVGLHGADLGNMILLPPERKTALIEINPCVFWEPRFFQIRARLTNMAYFAFNCVGKCCFGGRRSEFEKSVLGSDEVNFEHATRRLSSAEDHAVAATWPASGYIGGTCGAPCDEIVKKTHLKRHFFGALRQSSVRMMIGKHPREFAEVLFDAFMSIGWAEENERQPFLANGELNRLFEKAEKEPW